MQSILRDQDKFDAGREEERVVGIRKAFNIMRDLGIDEDIITLKLKEEYQLDDDEIMKYLENFVNSDHSPSRMKNI